MQNFLIFIFFILSFFSYFTTGNAEPSDECAVIDNDFRHPHCYDTEFNIPEAVNKEVEKRKVAHKEINDILRNWGYIRTKTRPRETKAIVVGKLSTDTFFGRFAMERRAIFIMSCREDATTAYFIFDRQSMFDHYGNGRVTLTIDKKDPFQKFFTEGHDNASIGFWSGKKSIPFIRSLFDAKTLSVKFTAFKSTPKTVQFDLAGLRNAIKPLAKACHWKV